MQKQKVSSSDCNSTTFKLQKILWIFSLTQRNTHHLYPLFYYPKAWVSEYIAPLETRSNWVFLLISCKQQAALLRATAGRWCHKVQPQLCTMTLTSSWQNVESRVNRYVKKYLLFRIVEVKLKYFLLYSQTINFHWKFYSRSRKEF